MVLRDSAVVTRLLFGLCLGSISLGILFLSSQQKLAFHSDFPLPLANDTQATLEPRSGDREAGPSSIQHNRRRFRGTFSDPKVLWSPFYKVSSGHYQIAAEEGPCSCAGDKYTWDACPGPSPSQINASLQHGILEINCPVGVVGFYADDIHRKAVEWKEYPGHPVKTNSPAVVARCTTNKCEKFLESLNMCPKDDLFLTQALLRPGVASRRVDANLPLNVLVIFADTAPRAEYIASLIQTEKVLREMEERDDHTTFTFPFYNTIGHSTKRYFYATWGRNNTKHGRTFQVTPAAREGVPWLWNQLRSHGYGTGIAFEGCWNSEVEDFFGSYPYGGPEEDCGTNWNFYDEMGDYTFMNVFCVGDVPDGSYRYDNTHYYVDLDEDPICLGGDYQSNKFFGWGFNFIDAQEQMNKDKHRQMSAAAAAAARQEKNESAPRPPIRLRRGLTEPVDIPFDTYQPNHDHLIGRDLLSPHRQPWFLYHQTIYAHGAHPCAGMQFTDLQIAKYIRRLYEHGYLKNTVLVLVSDHGYGDHPDNPFLSLTLPNWLLNARPEIGSNLERNQYQLVSSYDIYMTLTHLLNYPNEYHHPRFDESAKNHGPMPGRSLFSEINQYRTCEDVGTPSIHCCIGNLAVEKLDPEDEAVVLQAMQVVEFINNDTAPFRSACYLWTLSRVLEAKSVGKTRLELSFQMRQNKAHFKAWFEGGLMVHIKQISIWNPNKKCMPKGVERLEFCQCMPVTISD